MAEIEDQLRSYADQVETAVPAVPLLAAPSATRSRPWRAWAFGAVASVALVIAVGAGFLLGRTSDPDVKVIEPVGPSTTLAPSSVPCDCPPTSTTTTTEPPANDAAFAQVPVPALVGLFADTAFATVRNVGLTPIAELRLVPFGDPQVGLVIDQEPAMFTDVDPGSEVVVVVGEAGPPPE